MKVEMTNVFTVYHKCEDQSPQANHGIAVETLKGRVSSIGLKLLPFELNRNFLH